MESAGSPRFFGSLVVSAPGGSLLVGRGEATADDLTAWAGEAATAHVRHVVLYDNGTRSTTVGPFVNQGVSAKQDAVARDRNLTAVRLDVRPTAADYELFVLASDGEVRADLGRSEIPALAHLVRPFLMSEGRDSARHGFRASAPEASAVLMRNDENRTDTFSALGDAVAFEALGALTVFVRGAEVTVEGDEGRATYRTGRTATSTSGVDSFERTEFVVLALTDASLAAPLGADEWHLFAPTAAFAVDGGATFRAATGDLGAGTTLAGDDATLHGRFTATVTLQRAGPDPVAGLGRIPVSVAEDGLRSRTDLAGEYRVAALNGQTVAAPVLAGLSTPEKVAAGVGLGALLLGLAAAAKKLLPALGLFARPEPIHPLLENGLRMRIHGLVRAYPGIHGRRLQSLAGVATGTFEHHVRTLVTAGLLREERIGGRVVYVPSDPDAPKPKVDRDELAVRALLMTDARRHIAEALAAAPRTQKELVEALSLPQQTVSFHLKALVDHAVLAASPGRPVVYSLNPDYLDLVQRASGFTEPSGLVSRVLRRVRGDGSSGASSPTAS